MIAGLPIEAWLLLVLSIVVPLAIEFKFFFAHRNTKQNSDKGPKV
jgi:hypothetical protein